MKKHERNAFLKFFLLYFLSVAVLILISGYYYFERMSQELLKSEHFSLIDYARYIKMGEEVPKNDAFTYTLHKGVIKDFTIENFKIDKEHFIKYIPINKVDGYLIISKKRTLFLEKLSDLRRNVIFVQFVLLSLFAILSYLLARNALLPLKQSIRKLDTFAKDLIHDLNTPLTSMKLNFRLLRKELGTSTNRSLERIEQSVQEILNLHENLKTLLEEHTFQLEEHDLCHTIDSIVPVYRQIFPSLRIENHCSATSIKTNAQALRQIIDNLLSNACKYNIPNGNVTLSIVDKSLFIVNSSSAKLDNTTLKHPQGTGLGLDIVKRLCENMGISMQLSFQEHTTKVSLTFL